MTILLGVTLIRELFPSLLHPFLFTRPVSTAPLWMNRQRPGGLHRGTRRLHQPASHLHNDDDEMAHGNGNCSYEWITDDLLLPVADVTILLKFFTLAAAVTAARRFLLEGLAVWQKQARKRQASHSHKCRLWFEHNEWQRSVFSNNFMVSSPFVWQLSPIWQPLLGVNVWLIIWSARWRFTFSHWTLFLTLNVIKKYIKYNILLSFYILTIMFSYSSMSTSQN